MPTIFPLQPFSLCQPMVFLAGSIEMGRAEAWQDWLSAQINKEKPQWLVLNPRRPAWDNSWEQSPENMEFTSQVNWELDGIEQSQIVVFYFDPLTKSPISLLEIGKHLERPDVAHRTVVYCPEGFWRKGNVDIVCQRKGVKMLENKDDIFLEFLRLSKRFE